MTNDVALGVSALQTLWAFLESHLDDFREMQGMTVSALPDLLAAAEAIGHNEAVWGGFANGGQQFKFADPN
jgi:F420-0:gamma-glutamyl ligase